MSEQTDKKQAARRAVDSFLALHGQGLGNDKTGVWVRACAGASDVYTRLVAASIAKDPQRARHHRETAEASLDALLERAKKDAIQRGGVGRLAELLADEGLPIPPKLGKWLASNLASSKAQKAADARIGVKDIEKAVICEAVYIASEWLPIYSNSSRAPTATAAEVVAASINDLLGHKYSQDKIITYWKESKATFSARG